MDGSLTALALAFVLGAALGGVTVWLLMAFRQECAAAELAERRFRELALIASVTPCTPVLRP